MKKYSTILLVFICLFSHHFSLHAQYSCSTAVPITNGYSSGLITTPGANGTQDWVSSADATCGSASNSAFTASDVYMFSYTTPSSSGGAFYFTINYNDAVDGEHAIGVWTGCSGGTLSNCKASTYRFDDVAGVCVQNLSANTTYYIGVGKQYGPKYLKFTVSSFIVESSLTIPSDECSTASVLNLSRNFSGSTRCSYTASATSPSVCGMSVENDSWMRFIASSSSVEIDYSVNSCSMNYGVQLAVFSGSCSSSTLISGSCVNYASNNSTGRWSFSGLTVGASYYIRTDGYAGDLCSYAFRPVSGVVLPVELLSFNAKKQHASSTQLLWETASEFNNDYFEIQKSEDALNFYSIGRIKGAGNRNDKTSYRFNDDSENKSNTSYYRLKQTDFNGVSAYSDIISVENSLLNQLEVFPNPSTSGVFELKGSTLDQINQITVLDVLGKQLLSITTIEADLIDLSMFNAGIYYLQIKTAENIILKKIIINKS
jgi:hypothetical protein